MLLDDVTHPIVLAPMAGGPSTPALAAAVAEAGGLGFLAGALITPDALAAELAQLRTLTSRPFGVNLFVPSAGPGDPAAIAAYIERVRPVADAAGVTLGEPRFGTDDYDAKLALLLAAAPGAVSFTFGCPPPELIAQLQAAGSEVRITATQVAEAEAALAAGADVVIAQGSEAGGHRGAWDDRDGLEQIPMLELVESIRQALPEATIVAAGAIMDGSHVGEALGAGAAAAQLGTAFLLAEEAGTRAVHRAAIATDRATALTRAFSGRRARAIVNRVMEEIGDDAPSAYPELVAVMAPFKTHAAESGDDGAVNLWAGERHAEARALPAAAIVERVAEELSAVGGG